MKKFIKLVDQKETYMLLSMIFMFLILIISLFFSTARENSYLEKIDSMKIEIRNKNKELDDSKATIEDQNKIILELTKENDKGDISNDDK